MRKLSILVLFWAVLGIMAVRHPDISGAAQSPVEEVRLSIPSMHCELCPFTVRNALERLPGVLRATASLSSKTATVWIRKGAVRIRDLERATDEAGYPSSLLSVQFLQYPEGGTSHPE
jgi:mercuric ion binding protein